MRLAGPAVACLHAPHRPLLRWSTRKHTEPARPRRPPACPTAAHPTLPPDDRTKPIGRHGCPPAGNDRPTIHAPRSEEHTSELQSLMRTSYAVFCLKKKKIK